VSILLAQNHLGRLDTFFGRSVVTNNISNCILPLFFSKTGACVIDSRDWELAKEMNPQLGKKLKVMNESIPILDGITAIAKTQDPFRKIVTEALLGMTKYPAGEQLLSAFKSGPAISYRPEYLTTTRVFWDQFAQTLPPTERAEWVESGQHVIPKQFVLPAGFEIGTAARR
jgi:ABC-type phosphate/phosphonate transport system substrate-binding protein